MALESMMMTMMSQIIRKNRLCNQGAPESEPESTSKALAITDTTSLIEEIQASHASSISGIKSSTRRREARRDIQGRDVVFSLTAPTITPINYNCRLVATLSEETNGTNNKKIKNNKISAKRRRNLIRFNHLILSLLLLALCAAASLGLVSGGDTTQGGGGGGAEGGIAHGKRMTQATVAVANKLISRQSTSGAAGRLARKLDLAKSSGQINEWLVHQVAPAMATKIIDKVLQAPKSTSSKRAKALDSGSTESKSAIDTQALADKIVDKLADRYKKRKSVTSKVKDGAQNQAADSPAADSPTSKARQKGDEPSASSTPAPATKSSSRRGKSLVGDSVQSVVQNLFSKDNRKLFGRAMEKSKLPLRGSISASLLQQHHHQQQQQHHNNNSWQMVREPVYDQNLFVSTDSSQLDENPVVLRAEHGHNLTTVSPSSQQQSNYQGQNLSPLISSLMSNAATNQIGQKLLQKHRMQQKYVHTNRHQQQHLAPKPWQPAPEAHSRRHQQPQSPYSLPVTSDMNIVSAPSSPAPPPQVPMTTTSTTTTTTSTTTPNPPPPSSSSFSFLPAPSATTVTQLGPNKFKINNRHQQHVTGSQHSSTSNGVSSGWYNNNRNHHQNIYQTSNNNNRYQHHHPSTTPSTTTSTSTTTTTTTTTTPEPPQTEPILSETLESLMDLDQQTSAPVSSILSSVAQSALESLSSQAQASDESQQNGIYNSYNGTSSSSSSSSSSSTHVHSGGATKGASPSTTSARHSVITAEAIPTALGAPLYHLTRANFTATSIMGPPPRRSGASPAAKVAAQYFQKGLNSLSSTIFGRQNKNWARRLGLSSMLLSGLIYGAAILANPGAPLPTSGMEVLQALTKNKRRRGSKESLLPPIGSTGETNDKFASLATPASIGPLNAALLDSNNNVNILYQQPQLIPIIEHLILQEQQRQQQQQSALFSQRSLAAGPIEIESLEPSDQASRRSSSSQFYTLQAVPRIAGQMIGTQNHGPQVTSTIRRR